MEVTVKDRQTLADIAIQVLGSFEGIFNLAVRNKLSLTVKLSDGDTLQWDTEDIVNTTVREKYTALGLTPATDIDDADYNELLASTDNTYCIIPPATTTLDDDENIYSTLEKLVYQAVAGEEILVATTEEISLTRIFKDAFDSTFA